VTTTSAVSSAPRAASTASPGEGEDTPVPAWILWTLGLLIIPGTLAVSADAGWLSFDGVSHYLGGWYWPASIDGAIVVMTLLRMFALCFRWRLPGAALFIWAGLGVTVAMNVESVGKTGQTAMRWAHGFEPMVYLVFVESLAWMLKMRLRLRHQSQARFTPLGFVVSPVVTTRAWLAMQRMSGKNDPEAARALVQRSIRARSQLLIICPSPWWSPLGAARRARAAALQTVRDGLLSAADVVELLPTGHARMEPVELLMAINRRALSLTVPADKDAGLDRETTDDDEVLDEVVDEQLDEEPSGEKPSGSGDLKKNQLKRAIIDLVVTEGNLDVFHPDSRVRNKVAKTVGQRPEINLHDSTATRYLRELLPTIKAEIKGMGVKVPEQRTEVSHVNGSSVDAFAE
jgi:hypothetical protein